VNPHLPLEKDHMTEDHHQKDPAHQAQPVALPARFNCDSGHKGAPLARSSNVGWPDQGDESGPSPPRWVVIGGPGEAGTILAMRALREQAAVNSSRSLYIRRYRCSAGVHPPLGQTWAGRGAKSRWLVAAIKGGKKLD